MFVAFRDEKLTAKRRIIFSNTVKRIKMISDYKNMVYPFIKCMLLNIKKACIAIIYCHCSQNYTYMLNSTAKEEQHS